MVCNTVYQFSSKIHFTIWKEFCGLYTRTNINDLSTNHILYRFCAWMQMKAHWTKKWAIRFLATCTRTSKHSNIYQWLKGLVRFVLSFLFHGERFHAYYIRYSLLKSFAKIVQIRWMVINTMESANEQFMLFYHFLYFSYSELQKSLIKFSCMSCSQATL